jgi:two-component system KDP operon response regulator KdpE
MSSAGTDPSPVVVLPGCARGLARTLLEEQLAVQVVRTLPQALRTCAARSCALVLLSAAWAAPDPALLSRLAAGGAVRTLVLGLRSGAEEAAAWLEAGADDYVGPESGLAEQRARVHALLRRPVPVRRPSHQVAAGPLVLSVAGRSAQLHGRPLHLTRQEFDVLLALARHAGSVVSAAELARAAGCRGSSGAAPRLSAFILRLRRKIEEDPGCPERLLTVRRRGYLLQP